MDMANGYNAYDIVLHGIMQISGLEVKFSYAFPADLLTILV